MARSKRRNLKYDYAAKIGFLQSVVQVYAISEATGDPQRVSPFRHISFAFCKNIDRIDAMAALPIHASHTARVMQSAHAMACWQVTGQPEPETISKSQRKRIYKEHAKIIDDYRQRFLSGAVLQEAWQADSNNFSVMLNGASDVMRSGAEAVFANQVIGTWIAFETLASDVWEKAVNVYPTLLAELKGVARRISDAANTAYSKTRMRSDPDAISDARADEKIRVSVIKKATHGFTRAPTKLGTHLREAGEVKFASLDHIRRAYSRAFSENHDEIDTVLSDKCFDALAVVRNVLVHKAGVVDLEYQKSAKGLQVPYADVRKPIELDGEITLKLTRAVVEKAGSLVEAVDSWIEKANKKKGRFPRRTSSTT